MFWAAWIALTLYPPVVLVPLAALAGMTLALIRLWKPASSGWDGAAALFLIGWIISVAKLGTSFGRWERVALQDAAAAAYFTLALVAVVAMKRRWSAWVKGFREGAAATPGGQGDLPGPGPGPLR